MSDGYWCPNCMGTSDSDVDERGLNYVCHECFWEEEDEEGYPMVVQIIPLPHLGDYLMGCGK